MTTATALTVGRRMAYRKAKKNKKAYTRGKAPEIGTPSGVYLPNEEALVRMLALKGATDTEIEEVCLLAPGTLAAWRKAYPSLDKNLAEGRAKPDANVLFAMYRNAVGYEYEEEQAVGGKEPCVLTVKKKLLGQFPAQKYWMENRQREAWKNRSTSEHTGEGGGPIGVKVESRNSIIDAIIGLVAAKPDPPPKKAHAPA